MADHRHGYGRRRAARQRHGSDVVEDQRSSLGAIRLRVVALSHSHTAAAWQRCARWRQRVSNIGGTTSFPLPFSPTSRPSPPLPSLPFPTLSPLPPSPPLLLEVGPLNPARGSGPGGALLALPAGSGAEPQTKSNLVHSLKIRHLVATILMILVKGQLTGKLVVYIVKTIFTITEVSLLSPGNINICCVPIAALHCHHTHTG